MTDCKFILLIVLFLVGDIQIAASQTQKKTPKAVFIILDGIPADVIKQLNPPAIKNISKAGGFTLAHVGGKKRAYNETPTISAPGYTSLITGTWANKHNVWDNDVKAPNYNYWNIFRIAEHVNPKLHTAIFSTWQDNRTKLIGEELQEAGGITLDYKFDGLEHDIAKYPHNKGADHIRKIDEAVTNEAARYILEAGPDLSWVYLEFTDDMGHQYGDSPQFYQAIINADHQVNRIWDAMKQRETKFNEDWLIIVTTDHGRNSVGGKEHGGQSERERTTWIATNSTQLNDRFKHFPGIIDIMPSIFNHLETKIPDDVAREMDGVPFIGTIDLANLSAAKNGNKITLRWKNFSKNKSDKVEVFVTRTNHFKEGNGDEYKKVGEPTLSDEDFNFTLENDSPFFKIVVKTSHHFANTWIVNDK